MVPSGMVSPAKLGLALQNLLVPTAGGVGGTFVDWTVGDVSGARLGVTGARLGVI
jgi:hypothetical protein